MQIYQNVILNINRSTISNLVTFTVSLNFVCSFAGHVKVQHPVQYFSQNRWEWSQKSFVTKIISSLIGKIISPLLSFTKKLFLMACVCKFFINNLKVILLKMFFF